MSDESYKHREIEPKWREYWISNRLHEARDEDPRPKYYCLDMFPYPSGSGLHVGHWRSYVLPDCWSRYKWLQGYKVLHPMGWDAFGSPAENDAIQKGIHPAVGTKRNVENFKRQLHEIGAMYDWSREINTTDPEYYKWTQWIFVKMFKAGLAYKTFMPVNWCPSCKTGIANEDVVNGRCERCGTEVTKKELNQWMLRITRYADRLLNGLEKLDWPEKVKTMQTNWIGRSEGAEVNFTAIAANGAEHPLNIFTTRPDTLFGATYMVMAPEHPLVSELTSNQQAAEVEAYIEKVKGERDVDRAAKTEKTGVFTGAYAINRVNNEKIPIWIADYVLMAYGTGAIMAVPAHDERDYEFAKKFGLEIREVISSKEGIEKEAYIGEGTMVNSGRFIGMPSGQGRKAIVSWLEEKGVGRATVNYKLRDWVFSRQRYWGEPIPVVHCSINCGLVPVPEEDLPVRLPEVERYQPTGTGESPLAAIQDWVKTRCPNCGGPAERETDTMPQWAGSSWYFLRYASPHAADALRMYELFVGPPELDAEWRETGIEGVHRFLKRAWHWVLMHNGAWTAAPSKEMLTQRHLLIKNVTERLEAFRMNTIVSSFMEFINEVTSMSQPPDKETVEAFLIAIAPFAPHFAEELWQRTGHQPSIFFQKWPKWDERYTTADTVTVAVQINGKLRSTILVKAEAPEESVLEAAKNDPAITRYLDGKQNRKKVYVKNRILNLVVG